MHTTSRARLLPLLALAGLTAALTTGCSLEQDAVCSGGRYPVLAVNDAGSDCVDDGREPAPGWARYPQGKVPERVGDKWYEYWQTRTLDENGAVVPAPEFPVSEAPAPGVR
ncbi:SCO0607 family lipoprotein [Streptomyces sp. NPDC005017]|uniref:SCO0607 family lipoprotein n=1 Tax=Streptomyces sp. NPDC005017 TaxID=3364706 RepID=UPI0036C50377